MCSFQSVPTNLEENYLLGLLNLPEQRLKPTAELSSTFAMQSRRMKSMLTNKNAPNVSMQHLPCNLSHANEIYVDNNNASNVTSTNWQVIQVALLTPSLLTLTQHENGALAVKS